MKILNYFFEDKKDTSLNFNYSGITKYCPLIVVGGFFLLTIVLFAFGPLNWNISIKSENVDRQVTDWLQYNHVSNKQVYAFDIGNREWTRLVYEGE